MIDHTTETMLSLSDAAKSLPNKPNPATVFRWTQKGCRGVILESKMLGGRRHTSEEALKRFFDRLSGGSGEAGTQPGSPSQTSGPSIRTSRQRKIATDQARRNLQSAGFLPSDKVAR